MLSFTYLNCGGIFYVFQKEGNYCVKVFDKWIIGETIEAVTQAIDSYCYHLINLTEEDQG